MPAALGSRRSIALRRLSAVMWNAPLDFWTPSPCKSGLSDSICTKVRFQGAVRNHTASFDMDKRIQRLGLRDFSERGLRSRQTMTAGFEALTLNSRASSLRELAVQRGVGHNEACRCSAGFSSRTSRSLPPSFRPKSLHVSKGRASPKQNRVTAPNKVQPPESPPSRTGGGGRPVSGRSSLLAVFMFSLGDFFL